MLLRALDFTIHHAQTYRHIKGAKSFKIDISMINALFFYIDHPNENRIAVVKQPFEENDDCPCSCRRQRVLGMHGTPSDPTNRF